MDKDYKTMIKELGWELEQATDFLGLMYTATKNNKVIMSNTLDKVYHACRIMETKVKEFESDNPLKDIPVREPPITEKKKGILKYFKFELYEPDNAYVNTKVKVGISVTDINTITEQKLFRTLDVLVQADKVPEDEILRMITNLNKR